MTLLLHPWHLPGRVPASLTLTGQQFPSSLPLQEQRDVRRLCLPDPSPQTTHKPTDLGLCTAAIPLQRCNIAVQSLILYSQAGYLHFWGDLEEATPVSKPSFFHNFCLPLFQQANKSKGLIIFTPLLPESIKITHKNYLGNSNAHQHWNKQEYFLCCDG